MTRQLATPEPLYVRLGDAFVILSATLLSLASGAWLIARFGFDLSSAILASLGAYCTLLLVHLLARRLMQGREDQDGETDEGEGDLHWQSAPAAYDTGLVRHSGEGGHLPADEAAQSRTQPGTWPEPLPMPSSEEAEASQAFKYRPSRLPYFEPGAQPEPAKPGQPAPAPQDLEARLAPSEINVEVIRTSSRSSPTSSTAPAATGTATRCRCSPCPPSPTL